MRDQMTGKRTSPDSTPEWIAAINLDEDVHCSFSQLHPPTLEIKKHFQMSRLDPEAFSLDFEPN